MKYAIPGRCYAKKNHRPIYRRGSKPFLGKSKKLQDYEKWAVGCLKSFFPSE